MTLVMQGPPPQQPGSPGDDPRPEQPHPLDDPGGAPPPAEEGEDEELGSYRRERAEDVGLCFTLLSP